MLLILGSVGISLSLHSQKDTEKFSVVSKHISRDLPDICITMDFIINDMKIDRNDMMILTPTLKSNEINGESLSLSPIVISGKLRNKIISRKEKLGKQDQLLYNNKPLTVLLRENNTSQSINYRVSVPYSQWMENASLIIKRTLSGCAGCSSDLGEHAIVRNVLFQPDPASYTLTYIVPEVEPLIAHSERHTVTFNYKVNSHKLEKKYKNNEDEFAKVEKIIKAIKDKDNLQITDFTITGYASPEGKFGHNSKLAEARANSFARYLISRFGISQDKLTVENKGEDWEGLRSAVSRSDLTDKESILNIIDKTQNPDLRDRQLKKLSDGKTYKTLLNDYYPKLRRTEYTIAYTISAIDIECIRQAVKSSKKELTLNEIHTIARSYHHDSKEFKEVFDIAVQLYPNDETAIINSAAHCIEKKDYEQAIERLNRIKDNPNAWNNLGVAYALKNDMPKAFEYFRKSVHLPQAEANLRLIRGTDK